MFYKTRFYYALEELGINHTAINPTFRRQTAQVAKMDGLWPKEAAVYVYYMLPKQAQIQVSPIAEVTLMLWIREGKVRLQNVMAVKDIAEDDSWFYELHPYLKDDKTNDESKSSEVERDKWGPKP